MREIKFKSYVKENGKIRSYIWEPFSDHEQEADRMLHGEMIACRLQFTGLKDKNGKEIYEGDVYMVAKNKKYIVKYSEGMECNFEWYGGCFVLYDNNDVLFPFDEYAMKQGEIIGNIYETPELLK